MHMRGGVQGGTCVRACARTLNDDGERCSNNAARPALLKTLRAAHKGSLGRDSVHLGPQVCMALAGDVKKAALEVEISRRR